MGADVRISEADYAVYQLLKKQTSSITLAIKYIGNRKEGKGENIDSEAVE